MKIYKAMAKKPSSSSKTQYHMFVGRWQPLHVGHEWLFQQSLNDGNNVLICIRDVEVDMNNPFSSEEIKENIETHYKDLISEGRVKVMIIPDINGICFGRGVGYDIIEYVPPKEIHNISATKIREEMKKNNEL
jgi:adenylylsulfate kinase